MLIASKVKAHVGECKDRRSTTESLGGELESNCHKSSKPKRFTARSATHTLLISILQSLPERGGKSRPNLD